MYIDGEFELFVMFEMLVVCIVVIVVNDGVGLVLLVVWGLRGFCVIICCCEGVGIGMKFGVIGIGGMLGSVGFGILEGVGIFGCMGCCVVILGKVFVEGIKWDCCKFVFMYGCFVGFC